MLSAWLKTWDLLVLRLENKTLMSCLILQIKFCPILLASTINQLNLKFVLTRKKSLKKKERICTGELQIQTKWVHLSQKNFKIFAVALNKTWKKITRNILFWMNLKNYSGSKTIDSSEEGIQLSSLTKLSTTCTFNSMPSVMHLLINSHHRIGNCSHLAMLRTSWVGKCSTWGKSSNPKWTRTSKISA